MPTSFPDKVSLAAPPGQIILDIRLFWRIFFFSCTFFAEVAMNEHDFQAATTRLAGYSERIARFDFTVMPC